MTRQLRPALVLLFLFTLLTGGLYPALVTALARGVFPRQAAGDSQLIGQAFDAPKYFWGRLSATTPAYNAAASSGSNLGPSNPALFEAVKSRVSALRAADPGNAAPVPVDLVTASGSGLDPHISPAAALYQVARVAKARGLPPERLRAMVEQHVEPRALGILGEPTVNVLRLNLALDAMR